MGNLIDVILGSGPSCSLCEWWGNGGTVGGYLNFGTIVGRYLFMWRIIPVSKCLITMDHGL